ncbi:LamG domain-containing protein [Candidatus Woesearchaeota archaeon]|nr:LamG domain-containing protein [Candidatus Woesearchaeota archaeon]
MKYEEQLKLSVILIFLALALFPSSSADISCNVQTTASCSDDILLTLQSDSGGINNSHVNHANQTQYANAICCSSTTQTIGAECNEKADAMLYLESLTNSHVQDPENNSLSPRYSHSTCVNSLGTSYCTLAESNCPADYECTASIASSEGNNYTNAHIGDCNAYNLKVCCFLNSVPTHDQPTLSSTDSNTTNDNLTVVYQNQNDADSDTITWTYDWRKTDTKRELLVMNFDEKITSTTLGAINDYSIYNNHGTLGGGNSQYVPNWTTNGKIGGAYDFDGADDYINISHSSSLNLQSAVSLSVWVYPETDQVNFAGIIAKDESGSFGHYSLAYSSGNEIVRFGFENGGTQYEVDTQTNIPIEEWSFITGTFDDATNTLRIYVDGELKEENASITASLEPNTNDVLIGSRNAGSTYEFNGLIDEPKIYNYALTQEQINASYYAGLRRYRNNYDGESLTLLHMSFDRNISNESTGSIKDYSVTGTFGTLGDGDYDKMPEWIENAKYGGGYKFDGVNDYISVPQNIIGRLNGSQTFILWYKQHPDNVTNWQTVLGGNNWAGNIDVGHAIGFSVTSKTIGSDIYSGDPYGTHRSSLSYSMPSDNNWHFVASAYNAETNTHYLRLDSSSKTSNPNFLTYNIDWSGTGLAIGKKGGSNTYWFNGSLDEVMIFDKYLSNEEILQIYAEGYNKLVSQETTSGDNWSVAVTPSDKYDEGVTLVSNSLLIENTAPQMFSVRVEPSTNVFTNNTLLGFCNATDVDEGSILLHYVWYRNGTQYATGTSSLVTEGIELNVDNITSGETTKHETWVLGCKADDGTLNSSWMNSSTINILNTPPTTVNLSRPTNNDLTYTNRTPFYNWTQSSDIDGDELTYELLVARNESFTIIVGNETGLTSNNYTEINELDFDTYYWKVRSYDGENYSDWSETWNYTLVNSLIITMTNSNVDFGTLDVSSIRNTSLDSPLPFSFRNDGNVEADLRNITTSESLWETADLDTEYWQIMPRSTGTFNESGSKVYWNNMSFVIDDLIKLLDYHPENNTVNADIQVKVPTYESPGQKQATLNFTWGVSQ